MKKLICVLLLLSPIVGSLFAQAPVLEKQIRTLYKNGLAKLDSPYVKKAFIGTGLSLVGDTLKCTVTSGTGTVTSVNATAPAAGFTVSGVPITTSGTMVFALSDDLAALEGMTSTGLVSRTAPNTYANRAIIAGGTGISVSNGDGVSGNPTITNSAPDVTVSLTGAGITAVTGTYPNFTITSTEVDGSTTNEPLTISDGTNSETLGGQILTVVGGGINSTSYNSSINTLTVTGTEVDGSLSNEGMLGIGAGGSTSSTLLSNTSGSNPVTINAAGILSISESTSSNGGSITLTGTEVDGSTTNEAQTLSAAGTTSPTVNLTAAGGAGGGTVTFASAGTTTLSQSGGTITITGAGGSNWTVSGADIYRNSNVSVGTTTVGTAKFLVNGVASSVCGLFGAGSGLATGTAVLRATGTATAASFVYGLDADISVTGGNLIGRIRNGTTTGSSGAIMNVSVNGASVNDPILQLQIEGQNTWALGADNSNSDRFTISASGTPGTSDVVNINTTGEMGVSTAPVVDLSVAYGLQKPMGLPSGPTANRSTGAQGALFNNTTLSRVEGKTGVGIYKTIWSDASPTFTAGPSLGTGGTGSVSGNEMCGSITFTTGTSPSASNVVFTINYPASMLGQAIPIIAAKTSTAAAQMTNFYISGGSLQFTVSVTTALPASTNFQIYYQIQQ